VWRYINISILPEHLQKAVWAGKITMGDIQEIEPVFTEARRERGIWSGSNLSLNNDFSVKWKNVFLSINQVSYFSSL